jgi:20S proteasome subunit beta 2
MSNAGMNSHHELTDTSSSVMMMNGGFNFDHVHRNQMMIDHYHNNNKKNKNQLDDVHETSTVTLPHAKKTGTTISGIIYQDGVVLGCDTRSTSDTEVAEKNCIKIHYIAPNIYCCGAGTAADTMKTTELIASQLELLRMDMYDTDSRVITAITKLKRLLYRYQGHIGAALIIGGVDPLGSHLYQIYPHGSTGRLPYTTMGSGSLAAMAIFESSYVPNMNEQDAVKLVQRSITAGIQNDLGSGSSCDICIIRNDGTVTNTKRSLHENDISPYRALIQRSDRFTMKPGLTPILKETFQSHPKPLFLTESGLSLNDVTITEMEVDE